MPRFPRDDTLAISSVQNLLLDWARRYTPSDDISEEITRDTLLAMAVRPELRDNPDLRLHLFRVLHQVARDHIVAPAARCSSMSGQDDAP